jgi:hypothetical protein
LSRKTKKGATGAGARLTRRKAANKRHDAERQRAREIGFLALAKEVAQENAEALRLLAKH